MKLWLVRAGKHGEYEQKFLDDGKIYLTWGDLGPYDLTTLSDRETLKIFLEDIYPDEKNATIRNWAGQVFGFIRGIEIGDWIVLPLKSRRVIAVGEVSEPLRYEPEAEEMLWFSRDVEWFAKGIPRERFDRDLLYSFGASMTICRISRNDAERRVREMFVQ